MSRNHKLLLAVALLGIITMTLQILWGDNGLMDFLKIRDERDRLVERNETIRRENVALYREIDRLNNDPGYVEEVARKELGLIGPEEIIVRMKKERDVSR